MRVCWMFGSTRHVSTGRTPRVHRSKMRRSTSSPSGWPRCRTRITEACNWSRVTSRAASSTTPTSPTSLSTERCFRMQTSVQRSFGVHTSTTYSLVGLPALLSVPSPLHSTMPSALTTHSNKATAGRSSSRRASPRSNEIVSQLLPRNSALSHTAARRTRPLTIPAATVAACCWLTETTTAVSYTHLTLPTILLV